MEPLEVDNQYWRISVYGETLGTFSPPVAPCADGPVVPVERLLVGERLKALFEGAPFPRYAAAASVWFLAGVRTRL